MVECVSLRRKPGPQNHDKRPKIVSLSTGRHLGFLLALPVLVSAQMFQFGAELRTRAEGNSGAGFRPVDDEFVLTRIRASVHFVPVEWFQVMVQAQDARVFGTNRRPVPSPPGARGAGR